MESWTIEQIQVTYLALQKGWSTRAMGNLLKAKGGNPAPKSERKKETMKAANAKVTLVRSRAVHGVHAALLVYQDPDQRDFNNAVAIMRGLVRAWSGQQAKFHVDMACGGWLDHCN